MKIMDVSHVANIGIQFIVYEPSLNETFLGWMGLKLVEREGITGRRRAQIKRLSQDCEMPENFILVSVDLDRDNGCVQLSASPYSAAAMIALASDNLSQESDRETGKEP